MRGCQPSRRSGGRPRWLDVRVEGPAVERGEEILTPEALAFVADLQTRFGAHRDALLAARATRRAEIAAARTHRLPAETAAVREGDWQVPPPPPGLVDRRVEITGPTEPKMAINALNCGANVWLADLEDANTPHWRNVVGGQVVLKDAVRRTLSFTSPDGKEYRLREDGELPTIVPRPRGWHLPERHLLVDGAADGRRAGRRRALPVPQRAGAARPRQRAVLLPAQDGGPPRGAALGARLRPRRAGARPPGRLDPRHDADRDHPGRVRDGGDAARAGHATPPRSTPAAGTTCSASSRSSATPGPSSCCPTAAR